MIFLLLLLLDDVTFSPADHLVEIPVVMSYCLARQDSACRQLFYTY